MRPLLVWFRGCDLRVRDHLALYQATVDARSQCVPVLALVTVHPDEWRLHDRGDAQVDLMLRCMRSLQQELSHYRIPLIVKVVPNVAQITVAGGRTLSREEAFQEASNIQSADRQYGRAHAQRPSAYVALRTAIHRQVATIVETICTDLNVHRVYWNSQWELDEQRRDALVKQRLTVKNIQVFINEEDQCLVRPGKVMTPADPNKPYVVFTPFKKRWLSLLSEHPTLMQVTPDPLPNLQDGETALLNRLKELSYHLTVPDQVDSYTTPSTVIIQLWPADQASIDKRLESFVAERIKNYATDRDVPSKPGTSQLSPYLALGRLSTRLILSHFLPNGASARAQLLSAENKSGTAIYLSELCWRDFYRHIAVHFPYIHYRQPYNLKYAAIAWRDDPEAFLAWQQGRTGYPLVDAAMRQLLATGWMHNRLRMLTASFLCKHLLIDWRLGERYFARHLVDYDFCSNNGGWQWTAGCGTDASPYFRVFAPHLQLAKFDTDGAYVRKWIPELQSVKGDAKVLSDLVSHFGLAKVKQLGYVAPIVEHSMARERVLAVFKSALNAGSEEEISSLPKKQKK